MSLSWTSTNVTWLLSVAGAGSRPGSSNAASGGSDRKASAWQSGPDSDPGSELASAVPRLRLDRLPARLDSCPHHTFWEKEAQVLKTQAPITNMGGEKNGRWKRSARMKLFLTRARPCCVKYPFLTDCEWIVSCSDVTYLSLLLDLMQGGSVKYLA